MPPEQSSLLAETLKLLPVLAGALLAILGGAVTQYLTHRFAEKRERRKLLREKAEALVEGLYAHSDWLTEKNSKLVFSKESHDTPSPLDKVWMIQKLYFPELREPIAGVMAAAAPMVQFNINQRIAQIKDFDAWLKVFDPLPYKEMYSQYLVAFEAAIAKVSQVVQSHVES
ncbi:MAG TPA: hypothetical protein VJ654_17220 [Noviherbaspirillum sp.]|nr:hypothetical protein [Noviherbaspirillum sp.]